MSGTSITSPPAPPAVEELCPTDLSAAATEALRTRRLAEVAELRLAVQWAVVHGHPTADRDPMVTPDGDGTPSVREYALPGLAMAPPGAGSAVRARHRHRAAQPYGRGEGRGAGPGRRRPAARAPRPRRRDGDAGAGPPRPAACGCRRAPRGDQGPRLDPDRRRRVPFSPRSATRDAVDFDHTVALRPHGSARPDRAAQLRPPPPSAPSLEDATATATAAASPAPAAAPEHGCAGSYQSRTRASASRAFGTYQFGRRMTGRGATTRGTCPARSR